jgi:tRNA modification GTPase
VIGDINQSIAAIASAPGIGQRGIIRCSGPDLLAALGRCLTLDDKRSLTRQTRTCLARAWIDTGPPLGAVSCNVLLWPTRHSYTRQPSAEIHCTAAAPVLHEIIRRLGECGIRQAAPGEFTLRAFLAGRVDLIQAEAVLGVIDSRSKAEMHVALQQLAGGLTGPLDDARSRLLDILSQIEAGLDFVEDDIEFISANEIMNGLAATLQQLDALVEQIRSRRAGDGLFRVAICGQPNTGKSSLFNALAGRTGRGTQAIVSELAGTTRDYSSVRLEFGGSAFELFDTAGIFCEASRADNDCGDSDHDPGIDVESARLAELVRQQAHFILFCIDSSRPLNDWEKSQICQTGKAGKGKAGNFLVVRTKSDLPASHTAAETEDAVAVSSLGGEGVDDLLSRIRNSLQADSMAGSDVVAATADRCADGLFRARNELQLALELARKGDGDEIVAASLRLALDELAIVTGRIYTDDILERIFSRFCIGK